MPSASHFNHHWKKKYPWITNIPKDPTKAFCRICNLEFFIRNRGEGQIKEHESRKKHQQRILKSRNQMCIKVVANDNSKTPPTTNVPKESTPCLSTPTADQPSSSSASMDSEPSSTIDQPSSSSSSTSGQQKILAMQKPALYFQSEEKVTKAEIIRALDIIDKNISFRAADSDNDKYSKMFTDSKIAKSYQMHKSKLCYVVGYGLEPYYRAKIKEDAKGKLYCFHFDETTTKQIKKQYDGYATYKTNTGIVTTYFGSLFVGRCSASKLKQHMFEFLVENGLELKNLINIGMDVLISSSTKMLRRNWLPMVTVGWCMLVPVQYTSPTMVTTSCWIL